VIFRVDPASGRLRGTIATGELSPAALATDTRPLQKRRIGCSLRL
jgi:hypothetical protein